MIETAIFDLSRIERRARPPSTYCFDVAHGNVNVELSSTYLAPKIIVRISAELFSRNKPLDQLIHVVRYTALVNAAYQRPDSFGVFDYLAGPIIHDIAWSVEPSFLNNVCRLGTG